MASRSVLVPVLLVALLADGCVFDRAGLAPDPQGDATGVEGLGNDSDAVLTDSGDLPDLPGDLPTDRSRPSETTPDVLPPPLDQAKPVDQTPPPPDQGPTVTPVSTTALGQALWAASVPCVFANGTRSGSIKIVDSTLVTFVDGAVALAGAPADTKVWVGGSSSVTVIYNLNSCDNEYPGDSDWGSAGLLIRKASLSGGQLVLQPTVTVKDINLIDVVSSGGWEGGADFALPNDSQLLKQLELPVGEAKKIIVQQGLN